MWLTTCLGRPSLTRGDGRFGAGLEDMVRGLEVIAYLDHRHILTSLILFFGYKGWVIHHSANK